MVAGPAVADPAITDPVTADPRMADPAIAGPVIAERVRAACAARAGLSEDALRLVDGAADGVPGLVVERYGDALRARGPAPLFATLDAVRAGLAEQQGPLFWRFTHAHEGGPMGDDGARVVSEDGLRFNVMLQGVRNPGLFLDARPARAWVRRHAADRRVLNLFSFTCAFGVAAAAGGARATTNVDAVGGALARGTANYALNQLPSDARTFWRSDVLDAVRRARKAGGRFDAVVLDPPPVTSGGKRGRRTDPVRDLAALVDASLSVLDPGGWLLLLARPDGPDDAALDALVGLGEATWQAGPGPDFTAPTVRARAYAQPR